MKGHEAKYTGAGSKNSENNLQSPQEREHTRTFHIELKSYQ